MLAWLLDPREGHGQGDQILRDLLVAGAIRARTSGLDGRSKTSRFFREWPPERIRTTGFGSAFVARELGIQANERVDLFVIDPQSHFVLVVENKAGTSHSDKQLDGYRSKFEAAASSSPAIKGYDYAFIALDRYFEEEDGGELDSSRSWLHLGYEWLSVSASRALLQVERGNAAARLVMSYCNRQANWESPQSRRAHGIASKLHHDHRSAISSLLERSIKRIEKEWLKHGKGSAKLLYILQNRSLERLLRETKGMASVASTLRERVASIPEDLMVCHRARIWICPVGWSHFETDGYWPVSLCISSASQDASRYKLSIVWNSAHAESEGQARLLRERLAELFPKFRTHEESVRRSIPIERSMTLDDLCKKLSEVLSDLARLAN